MYGGHFSQSVPALLDATVTGITGTVSVTWGGHRATASFVPNGETAFTLPVANRRATSQLEITADLTATLNVPRPPMLQTVHHPARTDVYTRRVTCTCGESRTVKTVRIYVHHPEHVRAVENQRGPVTRTRTESIPLVAGVEGGAGREPRGRRPLPGPLRAPAQASASEGGADAGGRFQLVELAMAPRLTAILLAGASALASVAAAPLQDEMNAMTATFDAVLTGMAYAGAGLCFFGIVWAGFLLMAEGAEGEGRGRAQERRNHGRGRPGGGAAGQGHRRRHHRPDHRGPARNLGTRRSCAW